MALRNIKTEEDPILRKTSRPVTDFNDRLFTLLDDMKETMYKADGVGLAAVQVGVLRRAVVIDCGDGFIELINPEIIKTSGRQKETEGCLSLPGKSGITLRPSKVKVKAQDRNGEYFEISGTDLLARAMCHEVEHLDGKLFLDKVIEFCE